MGVWAGTESQMHHDVVQKQQRDDQIGDAQSTVREDGALRQRERGATHNMIEFGVGQKRARGSCCE